MTLLLENLKYKPEYSLKEEDHYTHLKRLKMDFKYFFCHIVLESNLGAKWGDKYHFSKSFELQCDYVVACIKGQIKDLAIALPPRNSKSLIWSVGLPMFLMARDGAETIISVSHHNDVLEQFSSARKMVLSHSDYQRIIDWKVETNTIDTLRTSEGGHILTMVMENVVTGLGGNWIITDDGISAAKAENPDFVKKIRSRYTGTLNSRLNDKVKGHMIVPSQRLCEGDLTEMVVKSGYTYLELQAIAEEDQRFVFPNNEEVWERKLGDVLNPGYEPFEVLSKYQLQDGSTFAAQYQQRPVIVGNTVLQVSSIPRYITRQKVYSEIILSADTAGSISKTAANWGLVVAGRYLENGLSKLDILFVEAKKYEYPAGKARIISLIKEFKVTKTLVEKKSTGISLLPELRELNYPVVDIDAKDSKEVRFLEAVPFINQGRVKLPNIEIMPYHNQWVAALLYEVTGFPIVSKRDIVDALSHLINHVNLSLVDLYSFYDLPAPESHLSDQVHSELEDSTLLDQDLSVSSIYT